jgi:hypothetical protein
MPILPRGCSRNAGSQRVEEWTPALAVQSLALGIDESYGV